MSRFSLRRALRVSSGTVAAAFACVAVALGAVDKSATMGSSMPSALSMLLFASVLVVVVAALSRRIRFEEPSARAQRVSWWMAAAPTFADLEVALSMVAALFALFAASGGLHSPLYPILYAVLAFSATFQTRVAATATTVAVFVLEAAALYRHGKDGLGVSAFHFVFLSGAVLVHALFLRGLVAAHRRAHGKVIQREVSKQRDSARDYRLISVALGAESRAPRSRKDEERMIQAGSVATISATVLHTLSLLHQALEARSCALLWLGSDKKVLKVKEIVSDSDDVVEDTTIPLGGVLKAVVRDKKALLLPQTKAGQVSYYEAGFDAGAFLGVPVMDGPHLRGLLCMDRQEPFDTAHLALAESAAENVLHAIRSEQVFAAVERAKYEHERFYQASSMLVQALTLEQVMDTVFDAAAAIVDFDVAAITLYDAERKRHRIRAVREGNDSQRVVDLRLLENLEFRDNTGLASMVVKNKHYLPAAGALRDTTTTVFNSATRFTCESLLVLPLLSADEAIGTFTLASHRRGQFRKDTREMLGVISNQVAISMQNALMYKRMETMATTDGLTGLTNRRTFQERFGDLLERAQRHGHKAAVLLCDVDHFKSVNDTYGHQVGDEVLRQVARVLQDAVRKIDIPARYGGEEFVVVLEDTDLEGALVLAERIRTDVGKLVLDSDKGTFQITMSLGVSSFPADGKDEETLVEHADMSLYHAKESGRNQVVCYRDFQRARAERKAS